MMGLVITQIIVIVLFLILGWALCFKKAYCLISGLSFRQEFVNSKDGGENWEWFEELSKETNQIKDDCPPSKPWRPLFRMKHYQKS
ncbi:hypothetical protein GCM10009865_19720 [Aeromicrobium ponti]|uniref:Uncharacterized protein n=1 Tax=Cytobacillus oceanisediminis TaxID=665099 RepID=A0A562JWV3_9BACI|nr:hypothetical protein [Cytobacillus oceanisediminis]TWH87639.1 hypothetical protein IQ19_01881 [Cytobacillus oceanisediminis]